MFRRNDPAQAYREALESAAWADCLRGIVFFVAIIALATVMGFLVTAAVITIFERFL